MNNMEESVFAVKLCEMEEQYGKLQCRIRVLEQGNREKIRAELKKAKEEYEENTQLLKEKAKACRSKAVERLARAQLDYRDETAELMKKNVIEDLHSEGSSPEEDEDEADMLYAEFAMDFATLSVQQAIISALTALDRQKRKAKTEEDTVCMK